MNTPQADSLFDARVREALAVARLRHAALGLTISEGTGYGPSVGVAMAHHAGQREILDVFEAAIDGDWPDAPPLPKRLYGPEAAEIDRLRAAVTSLGAILCPRCEGQSYDVGSCGVCRNAGWLDENGDALNV